MVWEPFVIAFTLGLLVSGALWFIFVWPGKEPRDDEDGAGDEDDADDE